MDKQETFVVDEVEGLAIWHERRAEALRKATGSQGVLGALTAGYHEQTAVYLRRYMNAINNSLGAA